MNPARYNEVIYEDVYNELLERYDYVSACPKDQPKPAAEKKDQPKPVAQKKDQPKSLAKAQSKPKAKSAPKPKKDNCYSEEDSLDFMLCQRPDGSTYGTAGVCRKGVETTRDDTMSRIDKAAGGLSDKQKSALSKLSDDDLGRVATAVETKGLTAEEGQQVARGVEKLKEKSGGKKEGGQNLQDPEEAAKYQEFYAKKKDLDYKAPLDTSPAVVKATLERLKEEDPAAYAKTLSALGGKGSPTKEQLAEAGWKGRKERGEAVLKSLMDNDFKDVMGKDLSWRQGLQLDHRQAGSTGGTDTPSNWIWISTATNQAKGGMEAAAKKRGGTPAEKEDYIRRGLIDKLSANSKMSREEVTAAKGAGSAKAQSKAAEAQALKDNLPLMSPSQRATRINDATGPQMQSVLKASVADGKNPVTGRKTSYRPVLSGGNGERVRKAYGTVPQMKSLARMRWDEKLSQSDLNNIGGILKSSTGSTKSRSDKLDELLGNFPRTSGLTAAERIAILDAAE